VPVAPRTTSNGSFGGFAAIAIYLRVLLACLSIRASDFVVWKIWHSRGVGSADLWKRKGCGRIKAVWLELPTLEARLRLA
jgi:hypothetical protein